MNKTVNICHVGKYKMKIETSFSAAVAIRIGLLAPIFGLYDAVQFDATAHWARVMLFLKSHVQRFTGRTSLSKPLC